MPLSNTQKNDIESVLEQKIEKKLKSYIRETSSMPFLVRLIQDADKVAAYSFIHSLATTLGMSVYEQISKIIAEDTVQECFTRYDIGGLISREQKIVIDKIITRLRNKESTVHHSKEAQSVLAASSKNGKIQKEGRIADFYIKRNNIEHYFEIKTVKPNMDVFTKSKRKLLEWVARKRKKVRVFLALPYNPYHPESYDRFTTQGVLDRKKELLVGKEYWDFIGGDNTFEDLLKLFDQVGKRFKNNIHRKIKEVSTLKFNI